MKLKLRSFLQSAGIATIVLLSTHTLAEARDQINIVGSSTVYPFATAVAERFGQTTRFKTPKIESTGSGGGLKLFCEGTGFNTPDITNASRRIKQSELDRCKKNGVTDIIEVKIGYDGIVMAHSNKVPTLSLMLKDIFLALAKDVPATDGSETLTPNPYKKWSDVNKNLPARDIVVLGPPPTSGTRDAFVELAMEGGCKTFAWLKAMKKTDKQKYKSICHGIREDGAYVEAGENDNLIVRKITANPGALGIFGYSFLEQNMALVSGSTVNGITPEFDNIASGAYSISRSLFFYVKKAHISVIPGIMEYVKEFTSEHATGSEGYLADKGLIPLPAATRAETIPAILSMQSLKELD